MELNQPKEQVTWWTTVPSVSSYLGKLSATGDRLWHSPRTKTGNQAASVTVIPDISQYIIQHTCSRTTERDKLLIDFNPISTSRNISHWNSILKSTNLTMQMSPNYTVFLRWIGFKVFSYYKMQYNKYLTHLNPTNFYYTEVTLPNYHKRGQ